MAWSNNIHFIHWSVIWQCSTGPACPSFIQQYLGAFKIWGLESSESLFTYMPGGWCCLSSGSVAIGRNTFTWCGLSHDIEAGFHISRVRDSVRSHISFYDWNQKSGSITPNVVYWSVHSQRLLNFQWRRNRMPMLMKEWQVLEEYKNQKCSVSSFGKYNLPQSYVPLL